MIDVHEAIRKSLEFAEQIYASKLDDARVEEVDTTGKNWLITLSFHPPRAKTSRLAQAIAGQPDREYKVFQINKANGRVNSMKIREVGAKRWSS